MTTTTMLPILLMALAVGLAAWGGWQLIAAALDGEQRRLSRRLRSNGPAAAEAEARSADRSVLTAEQLSGLSATLTRWSPLRRVYHRLTSTYPQRTLIGFLTIDAAVSVSSFAIATLAFASPVIGIVAAVAGCAAPFILLNNRSASRRAQMARQLPDALDFLARILQAGHSLATGLQMMAEELPQPLASEFRRCYDQHCLGQPLDECLKDMAARVDSAEFTFFVTAVLIQRQTGGDLSQVLNNISHTIRQRVRLQQQVRVRTAEGRLSGYVLVAFPVVMFVLVYALNADYGRVLLHTSMGLRLLGVALGLELAGLVAIRRITTLKL